MNGSLIGIELGIGAALLAVWVDAQIGGRRPSSLKMRFVHTLSAFVIVQASSVALAALVHDNTTRDRATLLVFILVLPALVYAFVVGLWLLRTLKEVVA